MSDSDLPRINHDAGPEAQIAELRRAGVMMPLDGRMAPMGTLSYVHEGDDFDEDAIAAAAVLVDLSQVTVTMLVDWLRKLALEVEAIHGAG